MNKVFISDLHEKLYFVPGMKYDLRRVEEVYYDVKIRGLADKAEEVSYDIKIGGPDDHGDPAGDEGTHKQS